jgi:hypothetical protein
MADKPMQSITVNLFRDYNGTGPWLYVWHDVTSRPHHELSDVERERVAFAVDLERTLRSEFVRLASKDYARAVEAITALALLAESRFSVNVLDRGRER